MSILASQDTTSKFCESLGPIYSMWRVVSWTQFFTLLFALIRNIQVWVSNGKYYRSKSHLNLSLKSLESWIGLWAPEKKAVSLRICLSDIVVLCVFMTRAFDFESIGISRIFSEFPKTNLGIQNISFSCSEVVRQIYLFPYSYQCPSLEGQAPKQLTNQQYLTTQTILAMVIIPRTTLERYHL